MKTGTGHSRLNDAGRKQQAAQMGGGGGGGSSEGTMATAAMPMREMPAKIRASVGTAQGIYDAQRLRSQREIIRDVMLSASSCDTWLSLGELRALTQYGEASISAQLRHLRKSENGGYAITKRHREDAAPARARMDGRGECVWEYRIS